MQKYDTVDEYINSLPDRTKEELTKLRAMIKNLVPDTNESMSYGMPGYKLNNKPLIYFAGWKDHIGFYPTPSGIDALEKVTKKYKTGKGTLRFNLDKPIPWDLIEKIIKYRIQSVSNRL